MAIEYRRAEGHLDRLPALAADLVDRKVDVIVTQGGDSASLAAKNATSTIPIVFHSANDPVAVGKTSVTQCAKGDQFVAMITILKLPNCYFIFPAKGGRGNGPARWTKELAMPDLDQIKQAEQGCGTGGRFRQEVGRATPSAAGSAAATRRPSPPRHWARARSRL